MGPENESRSASKRPQKSRVRWPRPVAGVVVDYDAGEALYDCVESLRQEGVWPLVVVDNGSSGDGQGPDGLGVDVTVICTGRNLGYGAGVNRGVAAISPPDAARADDARADDARADDARADQTGTPSSERAAPVGPAGPASSERATESRGGPGTDLVLVCNPDVVLHPGSLEALVTALDSHPMSFIAGPRIVEVDGRRYPSARRFPSAVDAAAHALLAQFRPDNAFSRRYRMDDISLEEPSSVDWVSGACFVTRREAFEELGGFDEAYFMYAEDMDLCWRARQAGWSSLFVPAAKVTHIQGISTRRRPYRMVLAHHRSALRFAVRSERGWRRLLVPVAGGILALRLVLAIASTALSRLSRAPGRSSAGARPGD